MSLPADKLGATKSVFIFDLGFLRLVFAVEVVENAGLSWITRGDALDATVCSKELLNRAVFVNSHYSRKLLHNDHGQWHQAGCTPVYLDSILSLDDSF